MQLNELLKEFGLSDKETSLYLSLLELGPAPARMLARRTGINRGTSYDSLKSLLDSGLVSFYRKGKQFYSAESPERLLDILEEKQNRLQKIKIKINEQLPELRTQYVQQGGRPAIKVYEGSKGIRKILMDVLNTVSALESKEYFVYSSATAKDRQLIYKDFPEFNEKRIEKGIKVQTIALSDSGQTAGLDQRKQLPEGSKKTSATHEIIYGGKIAHIGLDKAESPVGVIIENEGIYEMQKTVFESTWSKLKN